MNTNLNNYCKRFGSLIYFIHLLEKVRSILYIKDIEKYDHNFKYNKIYQIRKKYFLLCKNCFWMSSTLPHILDYPLVYLKNCPSCLHKVDVFPIPKEYSYPLDQKKVSC
jgi:hypothetical protein